MPIRRRNTDEQLRRLERAAAFGDLHAADRLRAARLRATGIVPESHRIGMAELGVFTAHGDVLCLACAERTGPDVDPGAAANARCDRCGAAVRLTRDDVALLQNLRDELRVVHGIDMRLWQTGGMCVALGLMVGDVEVMIAVNDEGHSFVCDSGRILAGRSYDQPPQHTWQQFGFPPGAQWTSVPTGMLEWSIGASDQGAEADHVLPGATFLTRTVGEAAHLIARHLRRAPGVLPNPPVMHFLDTVDSAIAWALENVGDAREDYPSGPSSRSQALRERKEEEVGDYVAEHAEVMKRGTAMVWRAVAIPKGENPRLWIDWDELGTHWSFRRTGAGVYSGSDGRVTGPSDTVVIEATVKSEDIDWEYGFTSFWYYGTEQFECALKEGSTVEVLKVSGKSARGFVARANPSERQRNVQYLLVVTPGPFIIVRVPWPTPKHSAVMAAITLIMREHGLRQKDASSVEGMNRYGLNEMDRWQPQDHEEVKRLDAAFAGDKTKYGPFWLYDWRYGNVEAAAKLKAARKQADVLRRRIERLKTDVSGRFELVRKPTEKS